MKRVKKLLSIVLSICVLFNITSGMDISIYAATNANAKTVVDNICATNGFRPGVDNYNDCYAYASAFCNKMYGTAPGGTSGYTLTRPGNFYLVGQTTGSGVSATSLSNLLSQAMPGDVVQMKWYTNANLTSSSQHTAIIYSADSTSFTVLQDGVSWATIQKSTYSYSNYYTRWKGNGFGISLYRYNNYNTQFGASIPTQPSSGIEPIIYDDKNSVAVGETITFWYSGLSVCEKVNFFFEKDGKVYYSVDSTASKTMQTYFEQDGQYYIFCGGYINGNWYYSDKVCVNVLNPKLTATKTNLDIKELLTFTYSGLTYASNVIINFERNGKVYYSENVTSNRDFTTWFTNAGEYDVYVVGDSLGRSFKSNKIHINVTCKHNYSSKTLVNATCTSAGKKEYTCTKCNYSYVETINKTSHKSVLSNNAIEATCTETGKESDTKCSACGVKLTTGKTIPAKGHKYTTKVVKPTYAAKGYTLHTCSVCRKSYKDKYTNKLTVAKPTISKVTSPKSKQIKVTWGKKSYTGYQVQIATNSKFTKNKKSATIKSAKTVTKTFTKLKGKTKYYVRVRAYKTYNGKKYYSAWSKVKTVTTKK